MYNPIFYCTETLWTGKLCTFHVHVFRNRSSSPDSDHCKDWNDLYPSLCCFPITIVHTMVYSKCSFNSRRQWKLPTSLVHFAAQVEMTVIYNIHSGGTLSLEDEAWMFAWVLEWMLKVQINNGRDTLVFRQKQYDNSDEAYNKWRRQQKKMERIFLRTGCHDGSDCKTDNNQFNTRVCGVIRQLSLTVSSRKCARSKIWCHFPQT